ncbi:MAG: type II toxin-antitoxin system HicB family antitoxin, partial [Prolixibacteraceae bacterium]|nr:type II toxin-antitoxin system HicB family antitoxin [Prolixibacteraceae bacterium]
MRNYVVIIEECKNGGYSAYVPDLPGCISVGETMKEIEINIKEAINLYIEELKLDKKPVPFPRSQAISLAV